MIRRSILEMTAGLKDMKADQRALAPPVPLSPIPTPSLSNTSVLITGGASGLGLATVRALAAAGAHITVATNVPTAPSILSSLQASGYHVQEVLCDVADWDSLHRTFKDALAFSPTGALDVVAIFASVDNGPNLIDHVDRLHAEEEPKPPSTAELDVNLKGSLYTSALALHYFRGEAGKGRDKSLIFVSSLAGYIDDTHNSVYTASKFGMRGLWRSIRARAGAEMGVRCNLIAPWAIKTPMTAPIIEVTDKMGIKEGEGITFAKEETVVEAVTRCIGDKSVSGKLPVELEIRG